MRRRLGLDVHRTVASSKRHRSCDVIYSLSSLRRRRRYSSSSSSSAAAALENVRATRYLPKNILLVRHGFSAGNLDEKYYTHTPDWKVPLTDEGHLQAERLGREISDALSAEEKVCLYTSPYLRAKETAKSLELSLSNEVIYHREEPRIREQDFGNLQDYESVLRAKEDRKKFSKFFYRFQNGESGADVYDRVSAFIASLFRDCSDIQREDSTTIIVTHGITARLFLMRWFHWSVQDFERTKNPPNCGCLWMRRVEGAETYELTKQSRELIGIGGGAKPTREMSLPLRM